MDAPTCVRPCCFRGKRGTGLRTEGKSSRSLVSPKGGQVFAAGGHAIRDRSIVFPVRGLARSAASLSFAFVAQPVALHGLAEAHEFAMRASQEVAAEVHPSGHCGGFHLHGDGVQKLRSDCSCRAFQGVRM